MSPKEGNGWEDVPAAFLSGAEGTFRTRYVVIHLGISCCSFRLLGQIIDLSAFFQCEHCLAFHFLHFHFPGYELFLLLEEEKENEFPY